MVDVVVLWGGVGVDYFIFDFYCVFVVVDCICMVDVDVIWVILYEWDL